MDITKKIPMTSAGMDLGQEEHLHTDGGSILV